MGWDMDVVKQELRGPAALVMAPFNPDLSLNVEALETNIRYMLDRGLRTGQGFVICPCGTGEYLALSQEEHRLMVRAAVEVTDGRLTGSGGGWRRQSGRSGPAGPECPGRGRTVHDDCAAVL